MLQLTTPVEGPCGARAGSSPALTSPWSMATMPTAPGPSWPSLGTPLPWCSWISSWRMDTTSWRWLAPRDPRSGRFLLVINPCRTLCGQSQTSQRGQSEQFGPEGGGDSQLFRLKFGICLVNSAVSTGCFESCCLQ